jgi:hypothetical protein
MASQGIGNSFIKIKNALEPDRLHLFICAPIYNPTAFMLMLLTSVVETMSRYTSQESSMSTLAAELLIENPESKNVY